MKKIQIVIMIALTAINLLAEETLKITLQDGSTQEIKLSDLSSITFSSSFDGYGKGIFKIYSKSKGLNKFGKLNNSLTFKNLGQVEPILFVNETNSFIFSDIDSISLSNFNPNIYKGREYKNSSITFDKLIKSNIIIDYYNNEGKVKTDTAFSKYKDSITISFNNNLDDYYMICLPLDCNINYLREPTMQFIFSTESHTNGLADFYASCKNGIINIYLDTLNSKLDSVNGYFIHSSTNRVGGGNTIQDTKNSIYFNLIDTLSFITTKDESIEIDVPANLIINKLGYSESYQYNSNHSLGYSIENKYVTKIEADDKSYIKIKIMLK